MEKIYSINHVNGQLYKNEFVEQLIIEELKEFEGIRQFKVYKLNNFLNIVLYMNENYEIIYTLENKFETIEKNLKYLLKHKGYFLKVYLFIKNKKKFL